MYRAESRLCRTARAPAGAVSHRSLRCRLILLRVALRLGLVTAVWGAILILGCLRKNVSYLRHPDSARGPQVTIAPPPLDMCFSHFGGFSGLAAVRKDTGCVRPATLLLDGACWVTAGLNGCVSCSTCFALSLRVFSSVHYFSPSSSCCPPSLLRTAVLPLLTPA